MKKIMIVLFILAGHVCDAQNDMPKKDSIKIFKNELGINLLPLINYTSLTFGEYVRGSVNYRRSLNDKSKFRLSIGLFSYSGGSGSGDFTYYQLKDTFVIYRNSETSKSLKPQLNIGYEYLFRRRMLTQSVGADLFFNYHNASVKENYYWTGQNSGLEFPGEQHVLLGNVVDSLGTTSNSTNFGVGIQVFYNLRIPFAKHWGFSATLGPSLAIIGSDATVTERKTGKKTKNSTTTFDIEGLLLTDLSLYYRF